MFVAWGPDLTFLYNDEYAAVLGAKHPHALGQPFSQAWSDIWPQFGPIVRRVMAGEALSFEDLPIPMRRNGYDEDTWFSFSYTPLQDETEQIAGLFCACTETTSKVRGEQALRAQEALLEARVIERTAELDRVWRNSRDLLLVVDADGIFRALNPAWTAVLGYELDELVGRSFLDFIWPEDVTLTQGGHDRAVARDDLNGFENRYRHKDGTPRWISWNTSVEGELIYAYGRHITAEKEHAEALRRIEDQLRQAQKMEAVGQLTGGLAHDFNNLLTGVSGSLELLQTRIAQGRINDVDRYVNAAQGAAKRAAALTHRLLAFSRRQTLDPKPIVVNRLVRGMEELIRRTIGPEIALEVAEAGGLWTTLVDPGQLENALLNLCINARDSMLGGGRITIETANKWLDAAAAHERDLPPGQYVTLCVSDTGTGMAPDVIAKAFEPFFTTKPIGMGTGLGLSMVYGFVRQSNGQVRIYSEVGHGSNICLYLPRHLGADEADDLLPELAQAPRAEQGETVLVVDDEPTVRMLVSEVLEDLGYTAIEAADGAAGLKVLQSDVRLDLLVSDVGLPSMNGRQLADAAREVRPDLKVLFITGYAENAVLSHGHLEHGMHVLTKPFTMEALASRIKELINGK
ncbi:PAS domain-containing sensor histidine kinase [Roseomonas sp. KE2513]|uniref:hybrid sensor histidine kinase/response regulator n=1 Tax=Roseomonas sp. KE2513 TaxID=2479202 RepID=UPI001E2CDF85|nr:PAS domain-containing sensor histidine kinase [Roseomonas sp. KE2513]